MATDILDLILHWYSSGISALSINQIQKAIVLALKSDATLVTALGGSSEIREDYWPGPNWSFPTVRVNVQSLDPATDGSCHLTTWNTLFSILVFTEPTESGGIYDASSGQCGDLMDYVVDALHGKELTSSGNFVTETRIGITEQIGPTPEPPPGGWRGEVVCSIGLQET